MDDARPVLLFDGHCGLCNASVDFVLRHEASPTLRFASLQSEAGRAMLGGHAVPAELDSVVLVEGGAVLTRSDAALRVATYLRAPWSALAWLRVLPRFLRDAGYRFVAAHRYGWFGRSETCRVPTAAERARVLPSG